MCEIFEFQAKNVFYLPLEKCDIESIAAFN